MYGQVLTQSRIKSEGKIIKHQSWKSTNHERGWQDKARINTLKLQNKFTPWQRGRSRDGCSMQWCPSSIVYVQIVYFNDMYTSRLARCLANNLLTRTRISWTTLRSQQNDNYTICEECNFKNCILYFVWLTVRLFIFLLWTNTQAPLCKRLIMKKLQSYNLTFISELLRSLWGCALERKTKLKCNN